MLLTTVSYTYVMRYDIPKSLNFYWCYYLTNYLYLGGRRRRRNVDSPQFSCFLAMMQLLPVPQAHWLGRECQFERGINYISLCASYKVLPFLTLQPREAMVEEGAGNVTMVARCDSSNCQLFTPVINHIMQ